MEDFECQENSSFQHTSPEYLEVTKDELVDQVNSIYAVLLVDRQDNSGVGVLVFASLETDEPTDCVF